MEIDYISGEKFEAIASFKYVHNIKLPFDLYASVVTHKPIIIYCKTDYKQNLLNELNKSEKELDCFNNTFTIISHNSDHGIDDEFAAQVPNCVTKWYAQNCDTNHPKFVGIPIGIANSEWPHGDFSLIEKVKQKNLPKKHTCFYSAKAWTNIQNRTKVSTICSQSEYVVMADGNLPREQYLEMIASSKFVVCPRGNGIDTHRLWEVLYLGSIPLVENNWAMLQFINLPLVYYSIDSLKDVLNSLNDEEDILRLTGKFMWEMLSMSYWKNRIQKGI